MIFILNKTRKIEKPLNKRVESTFFSFRKTRIFSTQIVASIISNRILFKKLRIINNVLIEIFSFIVMKRIQIVEYYNSGL